MNIRNAQFKEIRSAQSPLKRRASDSILICVLGAKEVAVLSFVLDQRMGTSSLVPSLSGTTNAKKPDEE